MQQEARSSEGDPSIETRVSPGIRLAGKPYATANTPKVSHTDSSRLMAVSLLTLTRQASNYRTRWSAMRSTYIKKML